MQSSVHPINAEQEAFSKLSRLDQLKYLAKKRKELTVKGLHDDVVKDKDKFHEQYPVRQSGKSFTGAEVPLSPSLPQPPSSPFLPSNSTLGHPPMSSSSPSSSSMIHNESQIIIPEEHEIRESLSSSVHSPNSHHGGGIVVVPQGSGPQNIHYTSARKPRNRAEEGRAEEDIRVPHHMIQTVQSVSPTFGNHDAPQHDSTIPMVQTIQLQTSDSTSSLQYMDMKGSEQDIVAQILRRYELADNVMFSMVYL
ncbi:hypothetical protein ADUPG1_005284 [Aduncisulcus paluster]|uniref:Uncharacterized protein n=1 Tax=Aduncisulcus paluster TaxID=2918883 RepID=A0ABQ5KAJ9_9EUKA|nr:hypothetical protein ADUPG1_005284 [Aduncisulcus paluster]